MTLIGYRLPTGDAICAACCDGPMFRTEEASWIPLTDADPAVLLHADASCEASVKEANA